MRILATPDHNVMDAFNNVNEAIKLLVAVDLTLADVESNEVGFPSAISDAEIKEMRALAVVAAVRASKIMSGLQRAMFTGARSDIRQMAERLVRGILGPLILGITSYDPKNDGYLCTAVDVDRADIEAARALLADEAGLSVTTAP
ncbi:hypothetical protein ACFQ1S_37565, partial [Kibdelosporangium lantanae]